MSLSAVSFAFNYNNGFILFILLLNCFVQTMQELWITCWLSSSSSSSTLRTTIRRTGEHENQVSTIWGHGPFGVWSHDGHVVKSYELTTVPPNVLALVGLKTMLLQSPVESLCAVHRLSKTWTVPLFFFLLVQSKLTSRNICRHIFF